MKFGIFVQTTGPRVTPDGLSRVALAAESLDFDTAWVGDHVIVPDVIESRYPFTRSGTFPMNHADNFLEPLSTMTFLLARTTRLRLGTNVLIVPYRNPVATAKTLANIDWLSAGRLTVGIGVGWMKEEFEALAAPPYEERGRVTDEYLDVFKKVWTEDLVSHHGAYYQLDAVYARPQPVRKPHPPIYVGGHTAPALRRTARVGDGWNAWRLSPQDLIAHRERLDSYLRQTGRALDSVKVCLAQLLAVTDGTFGDESQRPALTGSVDQIAGDIRAYQAAGVDQLALLLRAGDADDTIRQLQRFDREIRPKVS
ncbi:MAG TPA: LLM class F420-dependent oxidoreductase [Dehalococcoidia bacterium]|nr:LLM class F420-dependent oxidoreductase [Dehalococcoidia bacterium]